MVQHLLPLLAAAERHHRRPRADNQLWAFNTTTDEWSLVPVAGGRIAFGNNSEGVHATDARTGTSFYTGGWEMAFNGSNNGTIKFESGAGDQPQWSFMTAQQGTEQGPSIFKGAMVGTSAASTSTTSSPTPGTTKRPPATIPAKRSEFCAGVSSFQITVTGGWDQFYERAFNDVYVLSLPSFRWIRIVSDSNNPDKAPQPSPGRNRHKCDMWRDAQMIATGGLATLGQGTSQHLNDVCNETYPPVRVLDTSTYTWRTQFEPRLEYSVPDAVTAVIGEK
ncbi:hypothetical protein DIS24_g7311 [Lasiodiplodia hormozganensis]|uniref:Uncharacterized protein n=1 Tax=Lasiodiplodia hormozganensis TaxID=869390 RepID=A0AA40CSK6_9PEZI|nr:hypothetical protein DIS24_g7311 [Lasiodiplodia hormozganensis]